MTEKTKTRGNPALIAAFAWAAVPISWWIAAGFEGDGAGDAFAPFYTLGWAALVGAGILMLLPILETEVVAGRKRLFRLGVGLHVLGVLTSVVFFWAVPVWAGLYAVAMALYAIAAPPVRGPALIIAGTMATGVAAVFVLTVLEVGTPDPTYGDYPIAWVTSYTIAAIGGAIGSLQLWRQRAGSSESTPALV